MTAPHIVFLDRDGVINVNRAAYVRRLEEFSFLPGALEALRILHERGYRVFVVSNQSAVGRGLLDEATLDLITSHMLRTVEEHGGYIERVEYCPHRPDDDCDCRKPKMGLLERIATATGIATAGAWLVGDAESDVELGRRAGCRTILIGDAALDARPDHTAPDLLAATRDIILKA